MSERKCLVCGLDAGGGAHPLCRVHAANFMSFAWRESRAGKPRTSVEAWAQAKRDGTAVRTAATVKRRGRVQPQPQPPSAAAVAPELPTPVPTSFEDRLVNRLLERTDWAAVPARVKRQIVELVL